MRIQSLSLLLLLVSSVATAQGDLGQIFEEQGSNEKTAEPSSEDLDYSNAHASLKKKVRALYTMTRIGHLPAAQGVQAYFRHAMRITHLSRIVQTQSKALAELKSDAHTELHSLSEYAGSTDISKEDPEALELLNTLDLNEKSGHIRVHPETIAPTQELPRFALPVLDYQSHRGAQRAESSGPGIELITSPNSRVLASAAGRVVFAEAYATYGNLVIVDHNDGLYTLYGNLGQMFVQVGDVLSRQAPIGSVSSQRIPATVYFEVRRNTESLDPAEHLGL